MSEQTPSEQAPSEQAASAQTASAKAPSEQGSTERANARKVREGVVVSNAMDKTAVVETVDRVRHRRYAKTVKRNKKLHVHDEENTLGVGDRVRVQETRPLSKNKRWRLVEVLERAK